MARAAAGAAVALLAVPAVAAGSPREIAEDLADGQLDGTYSARELSSFLNDATVQGYGNPVVTVQPPSTAGVAGATKVKTRPSTQPSKGVAGAAAAPARRGALPFTGVDLALMTAGGFILLALGAGMRTLARERG